MARAKKILSTVAEARGPGVYHSRRWGIRFDESFVDALEVLAQESRNGKARLCLHPNKEDSEQQMLVALSKDCADEVHFHPWKGETVLWVRGEAEHRTFDEFGLIAEKTLLGPSDFKYLHTPAHVPHHVVVLTDTFVFWELAGGPFRSDSTRPFAPIEQSGE